MTTFIQFLKQELLPGQCFLCHSQAPIELSLCPECLDHLPLNHFSCRRCANPLHSHQPDNQRHSENSQTMSITDSSSPPLPSLTQPIGSTGEKSPDLNQEASPLCGKCLRQDFYFDQVFSPFLYQKQVIKLLHRYKYSEQLFLARSISQLFLKHLYASGILLHSLPEVIIPIPLYRRRIQKRGFNQSIELAKHLAQQTNINIDYGILKRIKATTSQSGLNAKQRKKNIKNAFAIEEPLPYHHMVLMDDVMTTGNTVNEAARILKKAGAKRVDVWTIARA